MHGFVAGGFVHCPGYSYVKGRNGFDAGTPVGVASFRRRVPIQSTCKVLGRD